MRPPGTVPARYHYRHVSETGFTPEPYTIWNTREGHDRRLIELNRKHRGRFVCEWREILPGDFDYPKDEEDKAID